LNQSSSQKIQSISAEDIAAVVETLQSDWLTTGPKVREFERAFAEFVGAREAVAVSNGTAALHAAMFAIDLQPGDEVLVPAMTFAASANCIVYQGGKPVFVDVEPDTLLIDASQIEKKITPRTRGMVAVDYAGQPCDYDALRTIANKHKLTLIADACHAIGATYKNRNVGTLADLSTFSFHAVKNLTTGEGGMITTDNSEFANRMRRFRNHGITSDHHQRDVQNTWFYEMIDLGFNYRLTDFQCALGLTQLRRLPQWTERRNQIANRYTAAFKKTDSIVPLPIRPNVRHAYHLYVVRFKNGNRDNVFAQLRSRGVKVNVHYVPVHLHPFYQKNFGTAPGMLPVAEAAYEEIMTLPIYPAMNDEQVDMVIANVLEVTTR
jgi:perosamine synthetase